jgi:hypothetical protein
MKTNIVKMVLKCYLNSSFCQSNFHGQFFPEKKVIKHIVNNAVS